MTAALKITMGSDGAYGDVYSCCSDTSNKALLVWNDSNESNLWYTTYDFNNSLPSIPAHIPNISTDGAYEDVFCSYNSTTNTALLTWADSNNVKPWCMTYDFSTEDFSNTPQQISSTRVGLDVYSSVCSSENKAIITYSDQNNNYYGCYAIFDFGTMQCSAEHSMGSFSADPDIFSSCSNGNKMSILTWASQDGNHPPYYAIYDFSKGDFAVSPILIDPTYLEGSLMNIFSSIDERSQQVIMQWTRSGSDPLGYAIYGFPQPPVPVTDSLYEFVRKNSRVVPQR